ncbi:MAG: glycosyltransferase family 8 protein [Bacteroidales bacterium]|nr:glycosyltransferase family 8 protein [Fibrobacter sp.]MBR3387212.1 glycosyltransferase family 8 protein [Bacteroidales bacterium]
MSDSRIAIVCATDDNYAPYCGIMLTSVLENNKDREVSAYILIDKPLQEIQQKRFKQLSDKYSARIEFVMVDKSFFEKFPIKGDEKNVKHWSIVTYYRLYAEELLPKDVDKVLYLDCDIIVNRPIGGLFDMDWEEYAVGAVPDMCTEWQEYYDRLGYDRSKGYFNAGVLFMNLEYWRTHGIGQKCVDFLANNYDRIFNNDQDVLNVITKDCKRNLPVSYNYQMQLRMPYFFNTFGEGMKKDVVETNSPHIIHYAAELKPWMTKYYFYPFNEEWHKFKKLSPWRDIRDQLPKERPFIGFIKRYFLWPFGIMVKKPTMV